MDRLGILHDLDLAVDLATTAAKRYGELHPEHKEGRAHRIINCAQGIKAARDVIDQDMRLEAEKAREEFAGGETL